MQTAYPDGVCMHRVRALMVRVVPALFEVDVSHPCYQLEEGRGEDIRCIEEDRRKIDRENGRRIEEVADVKNITVQKNNVRKGKEERIGNGKVIIRGQEGRSVGYLLNYELLPLRLNRHLLVRGLSFVSMMHCITGHRTEGPELSV